MQQESHFSAAIGGPPSGQGYLKILCAQATHRLSTKCPQARLWLNVEATEARPRDQRPACRPGTRRRARSARCPVDETVLPFKQPTATLETMRTARRQGTNRNTHWSI